MISKKQANMYIWLAIIVIAVAVFFQGESGRSVFARETTGGYAPCKDMDDYMASYTDLGEECIIFLYDTNPPYTIGKSITLEQATENYIGRMCELRCYDCATEQSPLGREVCNTTATDEDPSGITGEPPTGTVTYDHGNDWISAKVTITNSLADPIAGMVSLEVYTEEERAARAGFGIQFACENYEDVQKLFSLAPGKTESTYLTSTNLPKGTYVVNVVSVDKCCKYDCEEVAPFGFGKAENEITLNLSGSATGYNCADKGGECKSTPDQDDQKIDGTCPLGHGCYKSSWIKKYFDDVSFESITDWWDDRETWQKIAIIAGIISVIFLILLVGERRQV